MTSLGLRPSDGLRIAESGKTLRLAGTNAFGLSIDLLGPSDTLLPWLTGSSTEPGHRDATCVPALLLEGVLRAPSLGHDGLSALVGSVFPPHHRMPLDFGPPVSGRAYDHAIALPETSYASIFSDLYSYGTRPRVPTCPALSNLETFTRDAMALLDDVFPNRGEMGPWTVFRRGGKTDWKVYLSLDRDAYIPTLRSVATALRDPRISAVKLDPSPFGLSRPDNFIIYVPDATSATAIREQLSEAIRGDGVHPLPFAIYGGGQSPVGTGWDRLEPVLQANSDMTGSWRSNICHMLTRAVRNGRYLGKRERHRYALLLLSAHGFRFDSAFYESRNAADPDHRQPDMATAR